MPEAAVEEPDELMNIFYFKAFNGFVRVSRGFFLNLSSIN